EIYCFTRTTAWVDYERIQGDVFDYLLAVMPEFGLGAYQQPSGQDLRQGLQGMLEGRDAEASSFEALAAPSRSDEATV
ncbi:mechanosensitive ion channel family protein, partial [Escherichia coli]|nr:mechanosensitive ion channel family protein [Escherichia coli]